MLLATLLLCLQPPASPPAQPPSRAPGPAAQVEQARLEATIRALPAKRSPVGDEDHERGLLETQELLQQAIRDLGFTPVAHPVFWRPRADRPSSKPPGDAATAPAAPPQKWFNYSFDIKGVEKPEEVYIVSAHFDAVPDSPGADDDGTGVAAVLEMARVLKSAPMRRTVRFVLFNLEESGFIGAQQYAADAAEAIGRKEYALQGMMSLEMLGYYSDQPDSQKNPMAALKGLGVPTVGDFIVLAGVLSGRPFIRTLEEQMRAAEPACKVFAFDMLPVAPRDILRSDHAPFLLRGYPAVMVTDTANFRNPNYHKPTDTIESLDLARYTRTVRALTGAVHAMAGPVGQPDAPAPNLEGLPDITKLLPALPDGPPDQPRKQP